MSFQQIMPDRDAFLRTAVPGTLYPIFFHLPLDGLQPCDLYGRVRTGGHGYLLETGKGNGPSFIGFDLRRTWKSRGTVCRIEGDEEREVIGNPFEVLREEFAKVTLTPNPAVGTFSGGAVGYLSYDMARYVERLPEHAVDDLEIPESCFLWYDGFFEFDSEQNLLRIGYLVSVDRTDSLQAYDHAVERITAMASIVAEARTPGEFLLHTDPAVERDDVIEASMSAEEFEEVVRRTKEYIVAGDIFQANLSVRFSQRFDADPFLLYRVLRGINPSPYMCFFETPELSIVSASPELLLRVCGDLLETRPIAGTRPRGKNEAEDRANAAELMANEKERAEHLMLVDLERNDIGRVARYGTVEVDELMAIETYSHVIHIVSNVRGRLAGGRDLFDAIVACFPGGTITGAPKVRSMEIIDELEPCRRGIYTGSIGWLGFDGNAELNIAIRTILVKDRTAYMQAGAGIVADSEPSFEYRESVRKAEAALVALRIASQEGEAERV